MSRRSGRHRFAQLRIDLVVKPTMRAGFAFRDAGFAPGRPAMRRVRDRMLGSETWFDSRSEGRAADSRFLPGDIVGVPDWVPVPDSEGGP